MYNFELLPSAKYTSRFTHFHCLDFSILEVLDDRPYLFSLHSKHIEYQSNPKDAYRVASFIIQILNGYARLAHENQEEVRELEVGEITPHDNKVISKEEYVVKADFARIDDLFNIEYVVEDKGAFKLFNLAFKKGFIRNFLLIAGDGLSFENLYKMLDEIKLFLKGKEKLQTYISKKQEKSFTHTANNFEAIGLAARHGSKNERPPETPIPLDQAQKLIVQAFRQILKDHFEIDLPFHPDRSDEFKVENLF